MTTWWLFSNKQTSLHNEDTPCTSQFGYFAVAASPFHPFEIASRLAAIDYDGTQNHIDGAFMKQVLVEMPDSYLSQYGDSVRRVLMNV